MTNELLLIGTLIVLYGAVLLWFYLFGTGGMMAFTVFATIAANIALSFPEAYGENVNVLIATGLILFVVTLLVNALARWIISRRAEFNAAD